MIEVDQQINAVERTVGSRRLAAGEARMSTISQTYDTGIDDLWEACTDPDRIRRWFLPVSGDLRVGGHYQLEGNAGGTIERCDRPHMFAATWEYGGQVSWIEVRLTHVGDARTRFELEHIAHVDDHIWAEFGPGATGVGWDLALIGLTLYLPDPNSVVDPEAVAAWTASADGVRFMTLSSARWCAANIASGTPVELAQAAAERTTTAYTAGGAH